MRYTQENFWEITQNNTGRLNASGGAIHPGPSKHRNIHSPYLPSAHRWGGPFIVDWQLSTEENPKVAR